MQNIADPTLPMQRALRTRITWVGVANPSLRGSVVVDRHQACRASQVAFRACLASLLYHQGVQGAQACLLAFHQACRVSHQASRECRQANLQASRQAWPQVLREDWHLQGSQAFPACLAWQSWLRADSHLSLAYQEIQASQVAFPAWLASVQLEPQRVQTSRWPSPCVAWWVLQAHLCPAPQGLRRRCRCRGRRQSRGGASILCLRVCL
mmetsp:Transcript_121328/g.213935  ORF Transcript_121328/g.213935 Transcript_121328/m.213935 type:complete len:209 (+) Transcript_121328:83-709(+)